MTWPQSEAVMVLEAIPALLEAIAAAAQPNVTTCPEDGCLLIKGTPCPACELRDAPRRCACGRRLTCPEADVCWVCLQAARRRPARSCACGTSIRTDADQCAQCRKKAGRRPRPDSADRPFRWVPRGGIMRPVFEEVA